MRKTRDPRNMRVRRHRILSSHAACTRVLDTTLCSAAEKQSVHTGREQSARDPVCATSKRGWTGWGKAVTPLGVEVARVWTRPPVTAQRPRPLKRCAAHVSTPEAPLHPTHTDTPSFLPFFLSSFLPFFLSSFLPFFLSDVNMRSPVAGSREEYVAGQHTGAGLPHTRRETATAVQLRSRKNQTSR